MSENDKQQRKEYDTSPVTFKIGNDPVPERKMNLTPREKKYPEIWDRMSDLDVGEDFSVEVQDGAHLQKLAGAARNYARIQAEDGRKYSVIVRPEENTFWIVRKEDQEIEAEEDSYEGDEDENEEEDI